MSSQRKKDVSKYCFEESQKIAADFAKTLTKLGVPRVEAYAFLDEFIQRITVLADDCECPTEEVVNNIFAAAFDGQLSG